VETQFQEVIIIIILTIIITIIIIIIIIIINYATSRKVPGSILGGVTADFIRGFRQFRMPGVDSAS
jgi:hypothetical protein